MEAEKGFIDKYKKLFRFLLYLEVYSNFLLNCTSKLNLDTIFNDEIRNRESRQNNMKYERNVKKEGRALEEWKAKQAS